MQRFHHECEDVKHLSIGNSTNLVGREALHLPIRLALAVMVGMLLVGFCAVNVTAETTYTATVTIQGLPASLSTNVYLDGSYNGTLGGGQSRVYTFPTSSTTHWIEVDFYVPNSNGSAGTRYYDADTSWAFNAGGTHVFTYAAQYYLNVETGFGVAGGSGWYDSGSTAHATLNSAEIDQNPGTREVFAGWGTDASGTGLTSDTITMDGSKHAVANWKTQFLLTVSSDPQNVSNLLGSGWYDSGSQAGFSAPAISPADLESRLRFDHWSGDYSGQSPAGTVSMDAPKTLEAHYIAQYLLSINYEPANVPHSYNETNWYDANSNVQFGPVKPTLNLSSVERLRFIGWVQNGKQLPGLSVNLYMDQPQELTLSYVTQYYVDVRSTYGSVSGSGWYDKGTTARITATTTAGFWPFTYTLQDWHVDPSTGKLVFDNGSWTLAVDQPYVVEAVWNFDIFPLIATIAGVTLTVVVLVGIAISYRRGILFRHHTTIRPQQPRTWISGPTQVCATCGNRTPKGAMYCQKCGASLATAELSSTEDRVYDYVVKHEGVISLSKASQDLGISVDELKRTTDSLKKKGRLA